ncbi:major capsid protein [Actomonas aquatica]|uniref:Major capsid protein n=1 Tax=Actomonas aquatica TaxID=2866162 RepID=A0ABZ1CDA9_9BACT|nr:major capsid protein [Opitutus sp. WL0086]WRQ89402.1 major capsid protein [Opitutus sp. WL0086]
MKSNVTHNPVLSATFNKFFASAAGYVGLTLAPIFRAGEQASSYYVFDRENFLNVPRLDARAPGSPYARSFMKLSDDTFNCKNYGHESPVPDEVRKKYANAFSADQAAVRRNARIILFNHEVRVKALYDGNGVPNSTPGTKWDDYADAASDPIGDVKAAKRVIQVSCGMMPNTMAISQTVYDTLTEHPAIKAKFTNTDGPISKEQLRKAFEIENLVVAGQVENTANEGQALNPAYLWGDNVVLAVTSASTDMETPNAARTFIWDGGSGEAGSRVESYREDNLKSDVHRSEHFADEKLTGAEMCYRLNSVLTA